MSATTSDVDEADRLARVKLSCTIEPGDLRVTGLVSELGASKVLGYLEAAAEVEPHWAFSIGHELSHVDASRGLEQAESRLARVHRIEVLDSGGADLALQTAGLCSGRESRV